MQQPKKQRNQSVSRILINLTRQKYGKFLFFFIDFQFLGLKALNTKNQANAMLRSETRMPELTLTSPASQIESSKMPN